MNETRTDQKFQLAVNAQCSMPWPIFAVGPVVLIAATLSAAALTASALVGGWTAAHLMLFAAIPCAIALLAGLDSHRRAQLQRLATVGAAGMALAAPLIAPHLSSPELLTLWFLLFNGVNGLALAAYWPQRSDVRTHRP